MKTSILALAPVLVFALGCAGTPCDNFKAGIAVAKEGVVAADIVCPCLAIPEEVAFCEAGAKGLSLAVAGAQSIYNTLCVSPDAGPQAAPKPHTQAEFTAWLLAHGAIQK